jgi:hypothetical protein
MGMPGKTKTLKAASGTSLTNPQFVALRIAFLVVVSALWGLVVIGLARGLGWLGLGPSWLAFLIACVVLVIAINAAIVAGRWWRRRTPPAPPL